MRLLNGYIYGIVASIIWDMTTHTYGYITTIPGTATPKYVTNKATVGGIGPTLVLVW